MFGHEAVKKLVNFENKIIKEIGEEKMKYEKLEISEELVNEIETISKDDVDKALMN